MCTFRIFGFAMAPGSGHTNSTKKWWPTVLWLSQHCEMAKQGLLWHITSQERLSVKLPECTQKRSWLLTAWGWLGQHSQPDTT